MSLNLWLNINLLYSFILLKILLIYLLGS